MNLLGLLYYLPNILEMTGCFNSAYFAIIQKKRFAEYPCLHRININRFFTIFQMKDYMISYLSEL